MVNSPFSDSSWPRKGVADVGGRLRAENDRLRELVHRMEVERDAHSRRKRKRLIVIGLGVSLAAHLCLILYFATIYRWGGDDGLRPVSIEFAILHEESLTSLDDFSADELSLEEPEIKAIVEPEVSFDVGAAPDLSALSPDGLTGLSGVGEGTDTGLGGAGAGTSYFGIAARGNRFAYIVDVSGSMSELNRMTIASRELAKSVQSLPDYAHFHVVFFSDRTIEPPMQNGWLRARRPLVASFVRWLATVSPAGGTMPRPAFERVFALEPRPDVVFFMTDGIIGGFTADEAREMNTRGGGKPAVIHCIAFGDQGSRELLQRIANDSGGTYRYVPDGGM